MPTSKKPGGVARGGAASLRVSLTERCELRCRYCRTGRERTPAERYLPSLDRLAEAVGWVVRRLGVARVKLTGGEPLLRPGVVDFVRRLASGPGIDEISMTTNGTRLAALARELASAGLSRVNVSLDTLDPARFRELTRGGAVERVVAGIDAALAAGLAPVKLNAVLRRSSYERDVPALLAFAAPRGLEVRFIELMRTGRAAAFADDEFVSARAVRGRLSLDGSPETPAFEGGPARRLRVRFGAANVVTGWIEPVSRAFCGGCRRLRLDPRGRLRRCLMDPEPFELLERLGAGEDAAVEEDVDRFVAGKRAPLSFETPRSMAAIGG
ncbi:MAG: GTP 3',8-cyclase MoaA [Thermoanaerobaculia bacterium]